MATKRKPPTGGLTVDELKAYAAKRKGKPLSPSHRKAVAKGLVIHHARKARKAGKRITNKQALAQHAARKAINYRPKKRK